MLLCYSSHIWWLLSQYLIELRPQREGVDRAQLIHDQRGSSRTLLTVFSSNKKVHLILNIWLKPGIHAWQHAECGKILLLSFFLSQNFTSAPLRLGCFFLLFSDIWTSWYINFNVLIILCHRTNETSEQKHRSLLQKATKWLTLQGMAKGNTNMSKDSQGCMGVYCVFICLYIETSQI